MVISFARRLALALAATLLVPCGHAQAASDSWTQIWSDEFDGSSLDTAKWKAINPSDPGPYNNEQQDYIASQVTVAGGNLVLTATNQSLSGKPYRSGRVESKYSHKYGRFEIRADLPATKGTWPAIWLLPTSASWPTQGEIDIMENRGQQPNMTSAAYHFGTDAGGGHKYVYSEHTQAAFGAPIDYLSGFHDYAVEWDAKKIRLFIDDVNWYTIDNSTYTGNTGPGTSNFIQNQTAAMNVILNVAVGGDFLGDASQQPDGTSVWPQQMLVDYVRVFDKNNTAVKFANGDFEERDGSMAQWSVFGNRVNTNNVSIHNEAAHGDASLKLFGQFTGGANNSGVSQGITVIPGDEVHAALSRFIRSQDSITGTGNTAQMKIEFYNEFGARAGTSAVLAQSSQTIANGTSPNDAWADFDLSAVAPAGAVEARLSLIFAQSSNSGGAVHIDDVSFVNERLAASADFNLDGKVDSNDLEMLQADFGMETGASRINGDANGDFSVDGADLLLWQNQSNIPAPPEQTPSASAVPECGTFGAAIIGAFTLIRTRLIPRNAPQS